MSATYEQALTRATAHGSRESAEGLIRGSATEHVRDCWPSPSPRRRCHCGCGGAAKWVGGANAVGLMSGCEMSVRRWVRDGFGGAR